IGRAGAYLQLSKGELGYTLDRYPEAGPSWEQQDGVMEGPQRLTSTFSLLCFYKQTCGVRQAGMSCLIIPNGFSSVMKQILRRALRLPPVRRVSLILGDKG
ncbi:hypothetical protein AMECASPLE_003833, partial [Ameca splendens]